MEASAPAVSLFALIALIPGAILGIGSLVCWILEIIAAFKKEESPLLGILSIVLCSLGAFIIGWINAKKWGIQKIMIIWTILIVIGVFFQIGLGMSMLWMKPAKVQSQSMPSMPVQEQSMIMPF